jgi:2-amino-4-hydroxy-6-hydroxymethyldihydropteridine diphosphokinase
MVLIALGANLPSPAGSPRDTLEAALAALPAEGLEVRARSRWYRTSAVPAGSGPDFVNGAAMIQADLPPQGVLAVLLKVEQALGRHRGRRWAPRACDLDLIAVDGLILPDASTLARWIALTPAAQAEATPPALILPHPRLQDRGFVLRPLADVAPDWVHPLLGVSVRELLAALPPSARQGIEPV